ncbi:MAG: cation-transporting P-type ATPase, partial [Dehalobacterium sp.]
YREYGVMEYGPSSQVDHTLIVRQLQKTGRRVAVIGQEVSDLPAMKAANLAIVFTDAKPQLWNFAHLAVDYMNPSKLGSYFHQVNLYHQVVRQNISIVSGQTAVGSALGLAGRITPWAALLLQTVTGLLVAWNSRGGFSRPPNVPPWTALHEVAATVLPFDHSSRGFTSPYPDPEDSRLSLVQELGKRLQESRFLWHSLSGEEIINLMTSREQGLSDDEARLRLQVFCPNRLADGPSLSFWQLLKKQFDDIMVKILLGASGFCLMAKKYTDATTIITILLMNAIMGVIQEIKAHKSLKSLKKLTVPTSDVIRNGKQVTVSAEQLVPGDIIVLKAGDRVPADAVLLRSVHLEAEESSLTGETCP